MLEPLGSSVPANIASQPICTHTKAPHFHLKLGWLTHFLGCSQAQGLYIYTMFTEITAPETVWKPHMGAGGGVQTNPPSSLWLKLFVMLYMSFKVIIKWDIQLPKFFPRRWAPLVLEPSPPRILATPVPCFANSVVLSCDHWHYCDIISQMAYSCHP